MGNFSTTPTPAAHENLGAERDLNLRAKKRNVEESAADTETKQEKDLDRAGVARNRTRRRTDARYPGMNMKERYLSLLEIGSRR